MLGEKNRLHVISIAVLGCLFLFIAVSAGAQGVSITPPGTPAVAALQADLAAANTGDVQAQLRVGKALNGGTTGTVRPNFTEAFKWFQAASQQGSAEATAWLGSMYLYGHGVPQDLNQAASLIQSSASSNNAVGLRFQGVMFETGQGAPRDFSKAVAAFSKAVSLKDPESCSHLGNMFLRGLGVKKSVGKAQGLFVKGSRLGDSWSQLSLGEMFQSGNFMIAPRASKKSATQLAAANSLAPAALPGTKPVSAGPIAAQKPNLVKARKMFALAAAKGNRVAAFKLGEIYENGSGTAVDYAQAINFYRQSAAKRYAPAQLALGRITEMGLGTPVNLTFAYLWYNLAAEQDNAVAAERLQSLSKKIGPDQLAQAQALMQQLDRRRAN